MTRQCRIPRRDDQGSYLALAAVLMLAVLAIAAVVVDAAALRQDRRAGRLASDAAATAGASRMDPRTGGSPAEGCRTAWAYTLANLADAGATVSPPSCDTVFPTPCTTSTAARTATGTAGPYRVEITSPVPDSSALMRAEVGGGDRPQALNFEHDGAACQRLAVRIVRARHAHFGSIVGIRSSTTDVHSVATVGLGGVDGELVPLVVLDSQACDVLTAGGGGDPAVESGVLVTSNGDTPGIIAVDSRATLPGNNYPGCDNSFAIDAKGEINSYIKAESSPSAPGLILSHALAGPGAAKAYDPGDTPPGDNQVVPLPTLLSSPITRAPTDHRYNCKVANSCLGTPAPYIDNLKAQLEPPSQVLPLGGSYGSGWKVYKDGSADFPSAKCTTSGSEGPITVPAGNWFVDCTGGQGFTIASQVTFEGGNVVFAGKVELKSNAVLTVNPGGTTPGTNSIVFIRDGNLEKGAQASLVLRQTAVYLDNGRIALGGGSTGQLRWTAPDDGDDPSIAAYDFDDLALWSESSLAHEMGGAAGLELEGVMFMPNALPFRFAGQGTNIQTEAQFITRRLEVSGQGLLKLSPNANRVVLIPLRRSSLIR